MTLHPDILGMCAGILTSTAFIPQVYKIWRTKDTSAISLKMYSILTVGFILWLIYGIITSSLPIMINNGLTVILSISILYLKIKTEKS